MGMNKPGGSDTRAEWSARRMVGSHELKQGDVVLCYGMRLAIDCSINTHNNGADTVYRTLARIVNTEALEAEAVADQEAGICNGTAGYVLRAAKTDPDGTRRWALQGTPLARWLVEISRSLHDVLPVS
ncbi:hypothetical protein [Mycobacteroides abscessus]|uniref:hypothetical protein n=1 Tax=Mycobacteroides abscessus TaxID=36809 RepID=UPI00092AF7D4|nr:hypothetical protein [Mycobacteroides abscessus]SIA22106.1 Uncharacterised protein [Mycobacteroides abscessus subsp. abscessus]SKT81809.1 Uncharacterised protein [Mycobacteroides abscessus subsp. massiliense]SKT98440.1 Uncharacterised protein [Mycobacteroides abscessus subsp. massiliense]